MSILNRAVENYLWEIGKWIWIVQEMRQYRLFLGRELTTAPLRDVRHIVLTVCGTSENYSVNPQLAMIEFKRKFLSDDAIPYFIAEIGINHNGSVVLAKKMIDASAKAGASAVKFQKRDIECLLLPGVSIPEPTGYLSMNENDIPDETRAFGTWTYPDKRLEFSDEQHVELKRFAEDLGIDYIVSPWETNSVDFLERQHAKVLKVASIDATNYLFCEYIASKGIPTLVSTGMSDYSELQTTWEIFSRANCPMMFLHCTSAYPCPIDDKHLRCIPVLQKLFDTDVGFSGHGIGPEGTLGAIVLGARVIEKHVTLSRQMSGPDQAASLEFDELGRLIESSRKVIRALGTARKAFQSSEQILHSVLVKRIVTATAIRPDEAIKSHHLKTVVTNNDKGLLPKEYPRILGRTVKFHLKPNHVLLEQDLSDED